MRIDGTMDTIRFGTRTIPYILHLEKRKNLRIVISPSLSVDIYAPETSGEGQIAGALLKKAAWIAAKLDALESFHPLPEPQQFISGETLVYLGRQYRLKVEQGIEQPARLVGRFLRVKVSDKNDTSHVKRAVDTWFRKRAHETLFRYMKKCFAVALCHGIPEPDVAIRVMRRRWGSCSPKGRVTLNLSLIKMPIHCVEYVLMHELCHLKFRNHSKSFYSLLTRCMPDWRQRKEILDKTVT